MINKNFYPTPRDLISKMLSGVKLEECKTILEPSAGKGDIVEYILSREAYRFRHKPKIDCIELDKDLQATLKGKGFKVIHDDFLTFDTFKKYDLIVMNPPFDNGEKHLLKALEIQKNGGAIICLLNAETLNNPFSNTRKDLAKQLEEYGASIEFIQNGFTAAERKTDVETALVKVLIPPKEQESALFENLRQKETHTASDEEVGDVSKFTESNFIEMIVEQYLTEVKCGVQLLDEFYLMTKYCFKKNELNIYANFKDRRYEQEKKEDVLNLFIENVRKKYWEEIFTNKKFTAKMTGDLRNKYLSRIEELKDYDFSVYNIMQIREELSTELSKAVEDEIIKLFDEFSQKYSWHAEMDSNIHYYNGWATNKAWKINKKVIIPLNAFDSYNKSFSPKYSVKEKISDIIKVFDYLNGKSASKIDVGEIINKCDEEVKTSKIDFQYFLCTFYKKGTCHIEFKDMDLLEKFNIFGSQKKNWLPPHYGKKPYSGFSEREKEVIKEFNGEKRYNEIFANKENFLIDTTLLLGGGNE